MISEKQFLCRTSFTGRWFSGKRRNMGLIGRNNENPLDCDLLVIDETSMVDVLLMHALLKAVPDRAALLVIGSIPLLFGLAVVMPVLGHATWHLYRRAVETNPGPPQELRPLPKGRRYAAEFPASLFAPSGEERP